MFDGEGIRPVGHGGTLKRQTPTVKAPVSPADRAHPQPSSSQWGIWIRKALRIGMLGSVGVGLLFLAWVLAERGLAELNASLAHPAPKASCQPQPGMGPEMLWMPGGSFKMGDAESLGRPDELPVHDVTVASFAMGLCEVMFTEYYVFVKATGRRIPGDQDWGRGQRPVISVSWQDARDYAAWLSEQTGKSYRLPTEAEWEYAARSGAKQETWAGTSKESELGNYAVYKAAKTTEVGSKQPNAFGLYDLSGNALEWVEDCWHENYKDAPDDGSAWLESGSGDCGLRVVRGGSWSHNPDNLRSSFRNWNPTDFRYSCLGLRLAQRTR